MDTLYLLGLCLAGPIALVVTLAILAARHRWQQAKDRRDEWLRW